MQPHALSLNYRYELPGRSLLENIKRIAKDSQRDIRSIDGMGRLRMRIDPTLYHAWGTRLGYDCWRDGQFLREVERDNPEVRVKSGGTRLQVGFEGAKRSSQKFPL